ncbi:hypothetical protein F0562_009998 [Nyssa sinensis]|uniref:Armadillo repeat-containing domain-containing protein n=1 Tax=Nyssa sinensis TaxID=561372 RepID=A0A5J4ZXN4_9ASTE|nr:hypothetical protein F0562_009998 [Nyssa sinensis]
MGMVMLGRRFLGLFPGLSYNEADRVALADSGAIPILSDMLQDESEELRDNAAEALVKFSEDLLLHDRISDAFGNLSFQNMQHGLITDSCF